MLKNYVKQLTIIGLIFGFLSYTIYVFAAQPEVKKPVATSVKKADKAAKPAETKKEHKKKPTLKKKYADKK